MFLSTFLGKFYFQGIFKTVLYIQILFKPVQTLGNEQITTKPINLNDQAQTNLVMANCDPDNFSILSLN